MQHHNLQSPKGSRKKRKIVGRGIGSGHGKTSCRGQTGQKSRSGRGIIKSLEGGQMTLIRRMPKIGFRSHNPVIYQIVNLADLSRFKSGKVVDAKTLKGQGLIKTFNRPYKILGDGEIKNSITVRADAFSKSAVEKITAAGGKTEVVSVKIVLREKTKETW